MPFTTSFEIPWEVLGVAAISGSSELPWEVLEGDAFSGSEEIDWEVLEGTAFSGSIAINWEVVTPTAAGGDPDSILNLPAHAVASRLRADLHAYDTVLIGHANTRQTIGAKLGSGSVLSISNFNYNYRLDAVGDWQMTIPARDEHAKYIIDGTAKVLKLYYEGVGLVFLGMIEDYSFSSEEAMVVSGTDYLGVFANKNALWRISLEQYHPRTTAVYWYQFYNRVMKYAFLPYRFEVLPTSPAWIGTADDFIGIQMKFQSQSMIEVMREMESVSGVHFRIQPNQEMMTIGIFGDDSGIVIAPVQEDDPLVREQGALVLKNIEYTKSKSELVNMLVPQGSNDSFGIAVELKHSNYVYGVHTNWRAPVDGSVGSSAGRFASLQSATERQEDRSVSALSAAWTNLTVTRREDWPLDLIPQSLLEALWEDYLNPPASDEADGTISTYTEASTDNSIIELGNRVAAVAVRFRPDRDFYPTIASVMNIGGVGILQMSIVADNGGEPDTTDLWSGLLQQRNYTYGLPGTEVRRPKSRESGSSVGLIHISPSGIPAQFDNDEIEYGVINEVMSFMERGWEFHPPWPLLQGGTDYWLVLFQFGTKQFPGFDFHPGQPAPINFGDSKHPVRLLRNGGNVSNSTTAWFDGVNWNITTDLVMSIYGFDPNGEWPYAVEGMDADSVDDNGTGHRVFYMRDFDSILEHGLREAAVSFPNAIDARDGVDGVVPAANSLLIQSQQYLQRHKDPFEKITLTVTGVFRLPYVGQRVTVVYRGMARNENGDYKWVDLNGLYYVLEIGWDMSSEEIQHTFTFANIPQDLLDADLLYKDMARTTIRSRDYFGELQTAARRVGAGA